MAGRREVAAVLDRLAFCAELIGDRRAGAYTAAAWAIRQQTGDLDQLYASGALAEVRGVGKRTLAIVGQVLDGQPVAELDALLAEIPPGLFEVRRIRGLGPKKIKTLWRELGITSLGDLEYACRENRLIELSGFGAKTQAKVLAQLEAIRATEGLVRRDQAAAVLTPLLARLDVAPGITRVAIGGDYRRGLELCGALVVVAAGPDVRGGLAAAGVAGGRFEEHEVTVVATDPDQFGVALAAASSDPAHFAALVARAAARGLTLDPSGLSRDGEPIACAEEDDLYAALELERPAAQRRDRETPLVERGRPTPRLVTRADLRGALHNHTEASDGGDSVAAMRAAAAARGLSYLGISDHSQTAFYARGLEPERLLAQIEEIARLDQDGDRCRLLAGVESDILGEGQLDYDPELLARLDFVIASVHNRHGHDRERMTARMVAAARDPYTSVIGHPTGRLLLGRPPAEFDMAALLDACAESGCAIELNSDPQRLDLEPRYLAMARERGVLVSIAADAHSTSALDYLDHGVAVARRAGLRPDDVLNCRSLPELRAWLAARRPPGAA